MNTVNDCSFRDLYHKVCYIESNANINKIMSEVDFEGKACATGVLAYGYIDYEAGFTFEILCCAESDGEKLTALNRGNEHVSLKLRRGSVAECSIMVFDDMDVSEYQDKVDMVNGGYLCPPAVSETREIQVIDPCRNADYPDDVMVFIWKEDLQPEGCWVRCTGHQGNRILGKLLNEPAQNFGIHLGDIVSFGVIKQDNGPICLAPL